MNTLLRAKTAFPRTAATDAGESSICRIVPAAGHPSTAGAGRPASASIAEHRKLARHESRTANSRPG